MNKTIKRILFILTILITIFLGAFILYFLIGTAVKRSYTGIQFNNVINIILSNYGATKPNFLNYIYQDSFNSFFFIRALLIVVLLVIINWKSIKPILYIGFSLTISSCTVILCSLFYNNIVETFDEQIIKILNSSNVITPNLRMIGFISLIVGIVFLVVYSLIEVWQETKKRPVEIIETKSEEKEEIIEIIDPLDDELPDVPDIDIVDDNK